MVHMASEFRTFGNLKTLTLPVLSESLYPEKKTVRIPKGMLLVSKKGMLLICQKTSCYYAKGHGVSKQEAHGVSMPKQVNSMKKKLLY